MSGAVLLVIDTLNDLFEEGSRADRQSDLVHCNQTV
jgi:hypothetical protein